MAVVRVLLVDHNDDLLDGLSAWLAREPNVEIVGSARNGLEAVELAGRLRPDLVLMDISIPGLNGFEATRKIKSAADAPRVVLTTFHVSEAARTEAWAAGADDLIAQADVTGMLRQPIEELAGGRTSRRVATADGDRTTSSTKQGPEEDLSQ